MINILLAVMLSSGVLSQSGSSHPQDAPIANAKETEPNQPAYKFKGFYLGMSLAAFKLQAKGDQVWIRFQTGTFSSKRKAVDTPLCTDLVVPLPGVTIRNPFFGEVVCDASPGEVNPEQRIVAGERVTDVLYRFIDDRLYRIDIEFPPTYYEQISSAFREKYGLPTTNEQIVFENEFGATWTGESLQWKSKKQTILLREGPGDGPGQDSQTSKPAMAIFADLSLMPNGAQLSETPAVDF